MNAGLSNVQAGSGMDSFNPFGGDTSGTPTGFSLFGVSGEIDEFPLNHGASGFGISTSNIPNASKLSQVMMVSNNCCLVQLLPNDKG